MKETRMLMGMPITLELCDDLDNKNAINKVFEYFTYIDNTFSTYKSESEISRINDGKLNKEDSSEDVRLIFELSEKTRQETNGYFDIVNNEGKYDPSGLVKGFAILKAAELLKKIGYKNFYVEAGGDIQVYGLNSEKKPWSIGIKNPLKPEEIVKVVYLQNDEGIATSGSYERGSHIYNPKNRSEDLLEVLSITVIGKNIYEADRFATAAFVMQKEGIMFIEQLDGFEGYSIDNKGIAIMTSNFKKYVS